MRNVYLAERNELLLRVIKLLRENVFDGQPPIGFGTSKQALAVGTLAEKRLMMS